MDDIDAEYQHRIEYQGGFPKKHWRKELTLIWVRNIAIATSLIWAIGAGRITVANVIMLNLCGLLIVFVVVFLVSLVEDALSPGRLYR